MKKMKIDLKNLVKEKYGIIARQSKIQNQSSCCGGTDCCDEVDYSVFSEDYMHLKGYEQEADLGLGCGLPTEFAGINEGDHVLDLGSGAGNDCFIARALVGKKGNVTGLDFTEEMLEKANRNKEKLGYNNVHFVKGDIENMPFIDKSFNVVISNCVLNLVPDKQKAFSEIHRVLKSDGHFCVSDVVTKGKLPENLKHDAEMYAGCIAGAIDMDDYIGIISNQKFNNIVIHKQKEVTIPENILMNYLTPDEIEHFKNGDTGIYSVTISASRNSPIH